MINSQKLKQLLSRTLRYIQHKTKDNLEAKKILEKQTLKESNIVFLFDNMLIIQIVENEHEHSSYKSNHETSASAVYQLQSVTAGDFCTLLYCRKLGNRHGQTSSRQFHNTEGSRYTYYKIIQNRHEVREQAAVIHKTPFKARQKTANHHIQAL